MASIQGAKTQNSGEDRGALRRSVRRFAAPLALSALLVFVLVPFVLTQDFWSTTLMCQRVNSDVKQVNCKADLFGWPTFHRILQIVGVTRAQTYNANLSIYGQSNTIVLDRFDDGTIADQLNHYVQDPPQTPFTVKVSTPFYLKLLMLTVVLGMAYLPWHWLRQEIQRQRKDENLAEGGRDAAQS
jgi:hypothetical protein